MWPALFNALFSALASIALHWMQKVATKKQQKEIIKDATENHDKEKMDNVLDDGKF